MSGAYGLLFWLPMVVLLFGFIVATYVETELIHNLGLNPGDVITKWWNAPSNPSATGFGYTVRASQGTAEFKTDKGTTVVTFEGKFPK